VPSALNDGSDAEDAEDLRRGVRDRVLVQRVEEHVLRQVAPRQRPQRPRLEQLLPPRIVQLALPRLDELAREVVRLPAMQRGEAREVAVSSRSQRQTSPRVTPSSE
jgi:hypothetical protein